MLKSPTTSAGLADLGKATNRETDIGDDLLVHRLYRVTIQKLES